jgi:hypothetical protein
VASDERRLAEMRDPEWRVVVLLARIWSDKILCDHPELRAHLDELIATVAAPDHIEADPASVGCAATGGRWGPAAGCSWS